MSTFEKYVLSSEAVLSKYGHLMGDRSDCLWDQHIRTGAVTTFIGETSAGKTTFLHNLAYYLSQGKPFLEIAPPKPLKILYVDYESYNALIAEHLCDIGTTDNWHFINLEADAITPRGSTILTILNDILKEVHYDLVIVDPLLEAYPVKSEDDNMEASMQMLAFRDLARRHKIGLVLVHNTGKFQMPPQGQPAPSAEARASRKHMGRGASARSDRADIVINYVVLNDRTRLLKVAKARASNINTSYTLGFEGDLGFTVLDSFVSQPSRMTPETEIALAQVCKANPGMNRNAIYENFVKGVMPVSRSVFYRWHVGHNPPVAPEGAAESASEPATGEDSYPSSTPTDAPSHSESDPHTSTELVGAHPVGETQ